MPSTTAKPKRKVKTPEEVRREEIKKVLTLANDTIKALEAELELDVKQKVVPNQEYNYIPRCQLNRIHRPNTYKPIKVDDKKNQWLLMVNYHDKNGWVIYGQSVYTKKDPAIEDFINYYSKNRR